MIELTIGTNPEPDPPCPDPSELPGDPTKRPYRIQEIKAAKIFWEEEEELDELAGDPTKRP